MADVYRSVICSIGEVRVWTRGRSIPFTVYRENLLGPLEGSFVTPSRIQRHILFP